MALPPELANIKIVIPEGFDREPCIDFARRRAESYERFLQSRIEVVIVTEEERRKREQERRERIHIVELLGLPESLVKVANEHTWRRWRETVAKLWEFTCMAGEVIDEAEAACGVG
jgi:hypothetical protein